MGSRREPNTAHVDVLVQHSALDWTTPSRNEVAVTGAFISGQGGDIHHGLGGSSQLNVDKRKYEIFRPYLQLEHALKVYIPNVLGIQGTHQSWDDLSEQIGQMEKQYGNTKMGLCHSLWHKMGQRQETAEAWIAFIPEEYGLGVVKAGISLVFKLAESSSQRRKMIFDAFAALRDTLIKAHPERRSFRTNQKVNESVDRLYQTVVDSIQDLALLLVSEKSTWDRVSSKFKRRNDKPLPSTEDILQNLEQRTKEFHDALQIARDRALEGTEMMSRVTGIRTVLMHEDVVATRNNTEYNRMAADKNAKEVGCIREGMDRTAQEAASIRAGMDRNTKDVAYIRKGIGKYTTAVETAGNELNNRMANLSVDVNQMHQKMDKQAAVWEEENQERGQQHQELRNLIISELGELKKLSEKEAMIRKRETALQDSQRHTRSLLLNLLLDRENMRAQVEALKEQVHNTPKAVVSLDRFCEILAQKVAPYTVDYMYQPPDLTRMFHHPTEDLGHALAEQDTYSLSSQGQVRSLLRQRQFINWLSSRHPSLLLVDANIEDAALDNLSVISAFCATFITSLVEVHPDDLVAHFFCGLHTRPRDPWYGPNGLVRSLIMQLLMNLVAMDRDMTGWNLDFINHRDYLADLENHDLPSLCTTLHSLLYQFPPDMTIHCIVDSISCFNVDRLFRDLSIVMDCLRDIVNDGSLAPIVKVLLTNPAMSTRRLKQLRVFVEDPSRLVTLCECDFDPTEISSREVEDRLYRSHSPLPRSYSPLPRSCSPLPRSHHSRSPLPRSHSPLSPRQRPRSPLPPRSGSRSPLPVRGHSPIPPPYDKYGQPRVAVRQMPSYDYDDEGRYYQDYQDGW